jgi:hypothetical protein
MERSLRLIEQLVKSVRDYLYECDCIETMYILDEAHRCIVGLLEQELDKIRFVDSINTGGVVGESLVDSIKECINHNKYGLRDYFIQLHKEQGEKNEKNTNNQ